MQSKQVAGIQHDVESAAEAGQLFLCSSERITLHHQQLAVDHCKVYSLLTFRIFVLLEDKSQVSW